MSQEGGNAVENYTAFQSLYKTLKKGNQTQ